MCAILIPAIIGVAALGLLGGGGGSCDTCMVIPQQAGQGTNVVAVSSQDQYAYAQPQQSYGYGAPQQAYAPQYAAPQQAYAPQYGAPQYGAPAPQYAEAYGDNGVGASIGANGQSALGVGTYSNPSGAGFGANIGGIDASIGTGSRNY